MLYDGPPGLMLDLVPESPTGVDIEWIHPYTYAVNNPGKYIDPSGLQPNTCECCEKLIPKPTTTTNRNGSKCTVRFSCQATCNGTDGLAGFTGHRVGSRDEFTVDVCISCNLTDQSLKAAIAHELQHAADFCRGQYIDDCKSCKNRERDAYSVSCAISFPRGSEEYKRCVHCGIALGCSRFKGCVRDISCTLKDIGINRPN